MIKIFIIDDSVLFRTKIVKELDNNKDIKVVGTANDVPIAQKKIKLLSTLPDIIILDVELPKIDGLTYLKDELSKLDIKVIVCTSHYLKYKSKANLYGAVTTIDKSKLTNTNFTLLTNTILKINNNNDDKPFQSLKYSKTVSISYNNTIIAIGASTGGLEVLEQIIPLLNKNIPPILIVQHMGRDILSTYIPKIQALSKVNIKEAKQDDKIEVGTVYFAPFNKHLLIQENSKNNYTITLSDKEKVSYHRPSIDILFNSIATNLKSKAIAFILTGMGYDGVNGMKKIKENGGKTYAQNERSCKVFGMPKAAIEANIIDKVIDQNDIAFNINRNIKGC